jgi:replicative DNA helicase
LQLQIEKLKQYAKDMNCIIVFISQLQREIENRAKKVPTIEDIRLPNPLDLKLLNKIILLYREAKDSTNVDVMFYRPKEYSLSVNWNKEKIQFS